MIKAVASSELDATTQKSFYGKARVEKMRDKSIRLVSYGTVVLSIDNEGKPHRHWSKWSATTGRHIREFTYKYLGYPILKQEWDKMEVETI